MKHTNIDFLTIDQQNTVNQQIDILIKKALHEWDLETMYNNFNLHGEFKVIEK